VRTEGDSTFANVFVPDGQLDHFEKYITDYLAEKKKSNGDANDHKSLINTIASIRAAELSVLWTDDPELFPQAADERFWWEVWLPVRGQRDKVVADFRKLAALADCTVSEHQVNFPERTVLLMYGSRQQLSQSVMTLNCVAELRRAKDTAEFFDGMGRTEQKEWLDSVLNRLAVASDDDSTPRVPEAQRAALWAVFDSVKNIVLKQHLITLSGMYTRLAQELTVRKHPAFDFVVVDEAQDVSVSQLRFIAALGANRPNGLFFAGDLGQRIFQVPFSWSSQGVDVRGRARTLHVNYRTSHQIRMQADRLLAPEVADVDGNTEDRRGTVSVFNGPAPLVQAFDAPDAEIDAVAAWLVARSKGGIAPHEIGVFVRSEAELPRARAAVTKAALPFRVLDEHVETTSGQVSVCTMHLAKGLEFRAVAVMACDDEVIPLQARIESVTDEGDLEEVYNTERHLLYVACTRAREHLFVTGLEPTSEFLGDLLQS